MNDIAMMPAGPELDRLVGERVMGWTLYYYDKGGPGDEYYALIDHEGNALTWSPRPGVYVREFLTEEAAWGWWNPSANIGQAWEVLELMRERGYLPSLSVEGDGRWFVAWTANTPVGASGCGPYADSATLAICRAALLALEHP